jgi:hypothetical protein
LVIEYALALAAIANVTLIALQLAMMAVSIGVAPVSQRFHWLLWTYIAAAIHLFGLWAFWVRFSYTIDEADPDRPKTFFQRIRSFIRAEFQLCGQPTEWDVKLLPENLCSVLLSAWVSFLIVGHIIYGTTLFLLPNSFWERTLLQSVLDIWPQQLSVELCLFLSFTD